MVEVDQEYWEALAKNHSDIFDDMKAQFMTEAINEMTNDEEQRARLQALLRKQERELEAYAKDPVERFNRIVSGFYSQVGVFQEALTSPQNPSDGKNGNVLEFKK